MWVWNLLAGGLGTKACKVVKGAHEMSHYSILRDAWKERRRMGATLASGDLRVWSKPFGDAYS